MFCSYHELNGLRRIVTIAFLSACVFSSSLSTASAQLQQVGSETTSQFYDGGTVMIFAHQDDDVLWMYPFLNISSKFYLAGLPASDSHFYKVLPYYSSYYRQRWTPVWGFTDDNTYVNYWLNACKRTASVNYSSIYNKLKPIIASPSTKRIITHNNWGEYGHIHHKWINQAVRSLAVTYKKDVWMNMIQASATTPGYYAGLGHSGMPYIRGYFSHSGVTNLRTRYQQAYLSVYVNNRPYDLWTWHDGTYDYPTEWRAFVKAVDRGLDRSATNASVTNAVRQYANINVGACQ